MIKLRGYRGFLGSSDDKESTCNAGVKVTQSCPALCDPMDSTVHEILQARLQEGVAFPFTRGSSQLRGRTRVSYVSCIGKQVIHH